LLDQRDRSDLCVLGRLQRYRRGARIIRQGDASTSVFVLLEGRVKVTLDTPDGRAIVVDVYGRGDLVGEFEALGDYPTRAASVVALDPLACRVLTHEDFLEFLMSHPASSLALVRMMIRRLGAADRRRVDRTTVDAARSLARFLVEVIDGRDSTDGGAIDVDVPLTQDELASLIGISRNSMVRALTTLRSRELVATTRRGIRVPDPGALRRYAESEPPDSIHSV